MTHFHRHFHRTQPEHLKNIPWKVDYPPVRGDAAVVLVSAVVAVLLLLGVI